MDRKYCNVMHLNTLCSIFEQTPKVPLNVNNTTVDGIILANIPKLFHFSAYHPDNGYLKFKFSYITYRRTIDAMCVKDHSKLEYFNQVVCMYLPKFWSHSMPKEDKDDFLHALQNLYATTAASSGELTKAIRS